MAGQPWRGAVAVSERLKQIHQTTDSVSICKPVTKFSAEVDSPESVAEVLTNAFRSAESGRPGTSTYIERAILSFALRHSISRTLHPSSFRPARRITPACRSRNRRLGALQARAT